MMLALGLFVFELRTLPYQDFQRQLAWRHPENARVGERPSLQYTGPEADTITLSGVLMPELTGGRVTLEVLTLMADQGLAWPLIEGSGMIYGMYVVTGLSTTKTLFFQDGSARRIEFTLSLKRSDQAMTLQLDAITTLGRGLLDRVEGVSSDLQGLLDLDKLSGKVSDTVIDKVAALIPQDLLGGIPGGLI